MNFTSKQYQRQRISKVVNLAGPRYEKEVNVSLPIRSLFHALMKTERFRDEIIDMRHKLGEAARYIGDEPFYVMESKLYDQIRARKVYVLERLDKMASDSAGRGVRKQSIIQSLNELRNLTHELISKLELLDQEKKIKLDPQGHKSVKGEVNGLYELIQEAYSNISFFEGRDLAVFNAKSLLLKGEAGIGKTHLFCDFAKEAYRMGHPVYVFLGEEFVHDSNPLKRMSDLLDGGHDYTSTFKKIDEMAAKNNKRAIILIDAINEAQIKIDWHKLNELRGFKNICFAISIRTGYEKIILTNEFLHGIKSYTHPGLNIGRIEDISSFFSYFKVPIPEVPLIAPEFRNPLFIKIFCKTYSRKKTVRGKTGSTTLFEDYVRKQTQFIRKSANLPGAAQIWNPLIKPIAEWMGENGTDRILEIKAKQLIDVVFPGKSTLILNEMQRHWLLTRTPHYTKSGSIRGYEFRFPYQKFSDHLIVRYLINHHLDKLNPEQSFLPNKVLGRIIDSSTHYHNPHYGLVEALAIQIPEHLKGRELVDIAPRKFKQSQDAGQTFLNSLLWRSVEMKNETHKYFRESDVMRLVNYYMRSPALSEGFEHVLETILNTACIENHPLGAAVLHKYLLKFDMPNRDVFWQKFVHYNYDEEGSVIDRYLLWASSAMARKLKSKTSLDQTATVLSWLLASSDRRVRDKSTKALVNLLDGKYSSIIKLLQRFNDVDDVYIIERLYAVAYGCALRESNPQKLKMLAKYIYNVEFADNTPRVHILIRDYAKGVVELYHQYDQSVGFDKRLYFPPYLSQFPARVPSEKSLDKKYPYDGEIEDSYGSIKFSIQAGAGDFGRYVIESNLHRFTSRRLDGSTSPSEKDDVDNLLKTLSTAQRNLIDKVYGGPMSPLIAQLLRAGPGSSLHNLGDIDMEKINREKRENWKIFLKLSTSLSKHQVALLRKYVSGTRLDDNLLFDANRSSRWIFNRTIKLGWNPKLHGDYDRNLNWYSYGREPNKPERIGKKYQWQAFHEFMALTADNFYVSKDEGSIYEGTWQLSVRDIDPSSLISRVVSSNSPSWWSSIKYDDWRPELSDRQWIAIDDDLPDFKQLIKSRDRKGRSWVNLNASFGSKQPVLGIPKDQQYSRKHREIWSSLNSYIIRQSDLVGFMRWIKDKNFEGLRMPEQHEFSGIFYREFPNQPAFKHLYLPYYGRSDWHRKSLDVPFDLIVPSDEYFKESGGYDMSIEKSYSIYLPSKVIYSDMGLKPSTQDGSYKAIGRETIFFDPHIHQDGSSALLGSLTHLASYLESKEYVLVWTILGEKQMIGGSMGGRDKNWAGRFEFSGSYFLNNKSLDIEGDIHLRHLNTGS